MSIFCSNSLYAVSENKDNHARIRAFITDKFEHRTVDSAADTIDASFESLTAFPLQQFTEMTDSLEPDESLMIKVLSTTFPDEYVAFHRYENGEWTVSELAWPTRPVQVMVLTGYQAIQHFEATGHVPTPGELEALDGGIETLSFDSEPEMRGYFRAVADNGMEDIANIEELPGKREIFEVQILFGSAAVGFYSNEGRLPTDEELENLGGELLTRTFKTKQEKEIYLEALAVGDGWSNYIDIEE